jgi:2-isopropylmalate synthase
MTAFNSHDTNGHTARIGGVRTQVARDRTDIAIDVIHDDRRVQTVRGEGSNAFAAGLDALAHAYGHQAQVVDCRVTEAGFDFETGAVAEISLSINGEVHRGRGRGPDPVWAGLHAMCDSFEKSVYLALAKESKTLSPETISYS